MDESAVKPATKPAEAPSVEKKRKFCITYKWEITVPHFLLTLIGTGLAIASFFIALNKIDTAKKDVGKEIQSARSQVSGQIQTVQNELLAKRLVITSPSDGSQVQVSEVIKGRTPFLDKNTYLVVTPLETGDDLTQDGPIKIDKAGHWTAHARFGTGEVGKGQKFMVRALSTSSILPAGPLTDVPADAVLSDAITVVRR